MALRVNASRNRGGYLIRFFSGQWEEIAYIAIGISGLQAEIEFPSDWHEHRSTWVRLGFGLFKICFSFPWPWIVQDDGQCQGPTYGFNFFEDGLHLHWGKCHGRRNDPFTIIQMPWGWRHCETKTLSEPEKHPYTYLLRSGDVQDRTATIHSTEATWTRPWLPRKLVRRSIDVVFDNEVGEKTGTWKGGCIGCGYEMLPGETPVETLRRMERERVFT